MKCTSCNQGSLLPAYLDSLFPCHTCDKCQGNFIHLHNYLSWLEKNKHTQFVQGNGEEVIAEEHSQALLCPQTGTIMLKYRISSDSNHKLDLSPSINAIWLDWGRVAANKVKRLGSTAPFCFY